MTTDARADSLARRVRRVGGSVIRRLGLLPAGMPDQRGDDPALVAAGPLTEQVLVYFGSTPESIYQLEQWLPALDALHATHPVLVVTADSRSAKAVRELTHLRVVTVSRYATFDEMLSGSATRLALYVNHHAQNFALLRFAGLTHVSLLHGDSDKVVSVSNQAKAYDYTFVAGRAAVDRLAQHLRLFDAEERCVVIGRPQAVQPQTRAPRPDGRRTVLYAPTWEGAERTAAYGSVATHGTALARSVLADPGLRLVYRPHPLTGVRRAEYGGADAAVRRLVEAAGAPHAVSAGDRTLEQDFADADLLVCDVSAVAVDWLATGRPLVLTDVAPSSRGPAHGALASVARSVTSAGAPLVAELVRSELDHPRPDAWAEVAAYYLGGTSGPDALGRFLRACDDIVAGRRPPVAAGAGAPVSEQQDATAR